MKNVPALCALLFLPAFGVYSQFVNVDFDSPKFSRFLKTKTLVVIQEDDDDYNREMERAMKEVWTVTPYDFVKAEQAEGYYGNSDYSLLMPVAVSYPGFENAQSRYLAVVLCDPKFLNEKGFPSATVGRVILASPVRCPGCFDNLDLARINVRQLHEALILTIAGKLKQDNYLHIRNTYNERSKVIRGKTLAVHNAILKPSGSRDRKWIDSATFARAYPFSMRIVDEKAIYALIASGDTSHFVLYKQFDIVDSEKFFYLIMSPSDGQVQYLHPFTKEAVLSERVLLEMVGTLSQ